tara:strand:- start:449 stop:757 length:309 start_codon:yes stop_codon:yes gene_type:complete
MRNLTLFEPGEISFKGFWNFNFCSRKIYFATIWPMKPESTRFFTAKLSRLLKVRARTPDIFFDSEFFQMNDIESRSSMRRVSPQLCSMFDINALILNPNDII